MSYCNWLHAHDELNTSEQNFKRIGGGSDMQPVTKENKNTAYTVDADSRRPAILTPKANKNKWNLGGGLTERDQLDILKILQENND